MIQTYIIRVLLCLVICVVLICQGFRSSHVQPSYQQRFISRTTDSLRPHLRELGKLKLSSKSPISHSAQYPSNSRSGTSLYSTIFETESMRAQESKGTMKLGVLLLNLGGPEKMEDVEGFLYNLFADPDIIRLPSILSALQKPLAYFIAKRRAPKSSEAYKTIGGGSPIVRYTRQQASLIENQLRKYGIDNAKCYFAMRYWNPYTEEVLEEVKRDGINTLVIVPLYPQYSISTSGSSLKLLQDIFYKDSKTWGQDKILHTVVPAWYYRKGYIQAVAKLIFQEVKDIRTLGSSKRRFTHHSPSDKPNTHASNPSSSLDGPIDVLFSAHGVPQSYIMAGDPYQQQIEECFRLVSAEVQTMLAMEESFPFVSFHLSYQSRVGPVEWLKPYTETTIESLGQKGVRRLVVVPISFVSEHIETLEEIDMEYRDLAEENGIEYWRRVPALNTDEIFIKDMADMVIEALESPSLVLSEAVSPTLPSMPSSQMIPTPQIPQGRKLTDDDDETNNRGNGGKNQGDNRRMEQGFIPVNQDALNRDANDGFNPLFRGLSDTSIVAADANSMSDTRAQKQFGINSVAETVNGRFAMLGFLGTTVLELLYGHPVVHIMGLR